jgi:putative transposase
LQQSLKNLERAYKNFFEKRADFPRFKKKGHSCRRAFKFDHLCSLNFDQV